MENLKWKRAQKYADDVYVLFRYRSRSGSSFLHIDLAFQFTAVFHLGSDSFYSLAFVCFHCSLSCSVFIDPSTVPPHTANFFFAIFSFFFFSSPRQIVLAAHVNFQVFEKKWVDMEGLPILTATR